MSSSYRIRTELGIDKMIQVKLEQNFDTLELLSLYINPNDVYTRACSDYGVVVGRVFCNNGFGIPNAKVSIFIALEDNDLNNVVLSTLYPYKTTNDVNEDGYKYNLLPYTPSYTGHVPVGTFPDRNDVLTNKTVIQVYDKYFKYVASTNGSGDFMILGVPPGQHTLFMQVDLSDIGEFSFTPADLIRIGRGTESQFNGSQFKFSENYSELPQIVTITKTIQVAPFYGEQETCNYSISRTDFDLTAEAQITISPTAVFMGSLLSTSEDTKVGYNSVYNKCKIPKTMGDLCDLTSGPGQILAIRQSYNLDSDGLPILEKVELENGGKVIDDNGAWLLEVPMNLDYVYTDEEGNQQISNNPNVGIPTKGKYRFKVKWEQGPELSESTKRAYFLVPNVKEYGWQYSNDDPYLNYNINEQIGITVTANINSNSPNDNGQYAFLSTYLSQTPNYIYRLTNSENVQDLQIFYPDGTQYLSQNINSEDIDGLYFVFTRIDEGVNAIINFLKIDKDRFLLEQSYAFSLDWTDYANVQEAINCDDTFMELKYNKVYTVSQLIDRYVAERRPWNTTGIKNIIDDKCTGEYNRFPTNDVFFRTTFNYILYNIIFEIFRYITIILMLVGHILAFLWVTILPLVLLVVTFIQAIIVGICNFRNWVRNKFGRPDLPCPDIINLSDIISGNPFLNIGLPLLLYTEDGCERCNCRIENAQGEVLGTAQLTTVTQSSLLINSTDFELYRNVKDDEKYLSGLFAGNLAEGYSIAGLPQNRCPIVKTEGREVAYADGSTKTLNIYNFSSYIPYSEYLNSWWSKGRYFEQFAMGYQGGSNTKPRYFYGSTRMRVTLEPGLNNPSNVYHMDNFQILVLDKQAVIPAAGTIMSFQDRQLSGDLNYYDEFSDRGFTSGKTNNLNSVTYTWTNPINAQASYTTYNLTGFNETKKTSNFAADIEYFQVITGLTIGQYRNLVPTYTSDVYNYRPTLQQLYKYKMQQYEWSGEGNADDVSCYNGRFRQSNVTLNGQIPSPNYSNWDTVEELIPNIDDVIILILMRGVDVHSPRVKQRIDLTQIFRYDYSDSLKPNANGSLPNLGYSNNLFYVEGYYKMNIPLQPDGYPTRACTRHNQIGNNESTDEFGGRIFFNSYAFSYLPQQIPGVMQIGRFKYFYTTLPHYYSSLDITTFGLNNSAVPPGYANSGYTASALSNDAGYLGKSDSNLMGRAWVDGRACGGNLTDTTSCADVATYTLNGTTRLEDYNFLELYDMYRRNQYFEGGAFYQWILGSTDVHDSSCQTQNPALYVHTYADALGKM